tara:strand:- start:393 stop:581 length:189 start_codon:yes stop_codon:yes gene_type:complete
MRYVHIFLLSGLLTYNVQKLVESENKPNIIYFNLDDLGWMDTETYGSAFYEIRYINKLAESV